MTEKQGEMLKAGTFRGIIFHGGNSFCTRFATRFATILHINRITVGCATNVASIVRVVSAQTRSTIIMIFCLSLAKGRVNDARLRRPAKDPRVTLFVSYCAVNNRAGMVILSRG